MLYIFIYIIVPVVSFLAIIGFSSWRQDLYSWLYSLVGRGSGNLAGQRIWVIGCSQGIGEDIVYQLAAAKCELILSARTYDKLVNVAKACENYKTVSNVPNKPVIVPFDMSDLSEHTEVVRRLLEQVDRIDGVVLCAGRSQRSLISEMDIEVVEQLFQLNTIAPMSLTRAILPHFIKNNRGHICVIGSLSARIPATIMAAYGASKAALQSYFTTLRYEATAHNIKVTIIHPGQIQTDAPKEVFRDKSTMDKRVSPTGSLAQNRMSSKDCASITVTAMGNNMHEVWMSNQPILCLTYFYHYGSGFILALMDPLIRKMSNKRIKSFKEVGHV
ncbi:Dehydrogenase/reductase SDR family member 7-like [Oopsacas minuta]|uniref:Dehydrogenase/reductase SDR family member 7-like n=1 Tax=Oopsacas minuta TaxID=111878 RepID=A0AAV7KIM6_9METZ|nr:Dehydrogenase/reductase SDR family member 7-like [Oopsacas minuta]